MRYHAKIEKEGSTYTAIFADAPGCMTQGRTLKEVASKAAEALDEWLRAHLEHGMVPPPPRKRVTSKGPVLPVDVDPSVAVAVQLRWARQAAKLTQAELAKASGVSQQQIAKLERPDENPTIGTIKKVASALGAHVELSIRVAG